MIQSEEAIFQIFLEHEISNSQSITEWEQDCFSAMQKTARRILWNYPCAEQNIEDAVQNALIATFERLKKNYGERIENPKGYLITVTAHESLKIAKKYNVRRFDLPIDEAENFNIIDELLSHPKRTEIKIMYSRILKTLTPQQRIIGSLLAFGMKAGEIAETLSISKGSVYTETYKIKKKMSPLREYLKW